MKNKNLIYFICNPFLYLLIELIIINWRWGLESVNELSTIEAMLSILAIVLLPVFISFLVYEIVYGKEQKFRKEDKEVSK